MITIKVKFVVVFVVVVVFSLNNFIRITYIDINNRPLETYHFRWVATIVDLVMFDLCFLADRSKCFVVVDIMFSRPFRSVGATCFRSRSWQEPTH